MLIRKLFKFEGAHVVRDCSSIRCKESLHGHSYKVEVFLESDTVDNGQMVVDFGLLKTTIKDFIDSFDHTYVMWDRETDSFKNFIKVHSSRWIELPVSPSAEMFALLFYAAISQIINNTEWVNGEEDVYLHSVRVHETDTGWAQAFEKDYLNIWDHSLTSVKFSSAVQADWKDIMLWDKVVDESGGYTFFNQKIKLTHGKKGS